MKEAQLQRTSLLLHEAVREADDLFEICLVHHDQPVMAERCLGIADRITEAMIVLEQWPERRVAQWIARTILSLRHVGHHVRELADDSANAKARGLNDVADELKSILADLPGTPGHLEVA